MKLKLSKGYSMRGADMGRPAVIPNVRAGKVKLHLEKMPLDNGGYDSGGAYWGFPDDIYVAWNHVHALWTFITVRASNRYQAKEKVLIHAPWATFYR